MNKVQKKYFLIGTIFLFLALFVITLAPIIAKRFGFMLIENYIYRQIEFFLLMFCAVFYLFSPKYYKAQFLNFFIALGYYILFIKLFN